MHKNLVIVESPKKAEKLAEFLGDDYVIKSSYGHIRDLAKKGLGIAIDDNFSPTYEVSPDKKKVITELSSLAKKADNVWLASDEDREGEAIAWHLTQVLGLPKDTKRIVFNEITKDAILKAIDNPREVDMNLVNAQQARRILDRLVGFELSPVLWKKVKPQLSAGRVQSVTVRLLVEREREIIDFKSVPYYRVISQMFIDNDPKKIVFRSELNKRFETEAEAEAFLDNCKDASFEVAKHEKKPTKRSPAAPFTTSTLQQEAGKKLGMSVSQTMSVAQSLYENGYITYMRTDSVNLSTQAIAAAKETITKVYGAEYSESRNFVTKSKGAQEAHEAIRPSYLNQQKIKGSSAEQRLYELIWKRTIASQMASAKIEKTTAAISISNSPLMFQSTGEVILFDGFMILDIAPIDEDATETNEQGILPAMSVGDKVLYNNIVSLERFTQSPARYSEPTLVKRLEELMIGRPSTYAPTITTIINRGYVIKQNKEGVRREYTQLLLENGKISKKKLTETTGKEKNKLSPTDIGMMVNDYLETRFKTIMDYNFTADAEKEFDEIAKGGKQWIEMLESFYKNFHEQIEQALETVHESTNQLRVLGIDPKTGKQVSARIGRYGPMVQLTSLEPAEDEKPIFASMKKGQLIASITLEDALELFAMPRNLGAHQEKDVVIGIGRFGPYIRHDGKFTSIPKTDDPYTITLERSLELIVEKIERDKIMMTPIKTFEQEPELKVLNGRHGPYIAFEGANYKIPKDMEPAELSLEQCRDIIKSMPAKAAKAKAKATKTTAKAKTTTKAKTTKAKTTKTAKKKE